MQIKLELLKIDKTTKHIFWTDIFIIRTLFMIYLNSLYEEANKF